MTAIQASMWLPQNSLALRAMAPNEGDTNTAILHAVEEHITANSKHRGRQRHLPRRRRGPRDPRPARRAGRGVPPGRDELSGSPPPSRLEGQPFVSGIRSPRISRRACWRLRSPASTCRSASCRMVSVSSVALSVPSILKSDGVDRIASSHGRVACDTLLSRARRTPQDPASAPFAGCRTAGGNDQQRHARKQSPPGQPSASRNAHAQSAAPRRTRIVCHGTPVSTALPHGLLM